MKICNTFRQLDDDHNGPGAVPEITCRRITVINSSNSKTLKYININRPDTPTRRLPPLPSALKTYAQDGMGTALRKLVISKITSTLFILMMSIT